MLLWPLIAEILPFFHPGNWFTVALQIGTLCYRIAIMHFTSSRAAKDAVEELKAIREDISVKSDDETAYPSKLFDEVVFKLHELYPKPLYSSSIERQKLGVAYYIPYKPECYQIISNC
jgi:hypothetical protein